MEAYIEFCNNMKRFAKIEEDKAYNSLLRRFQIRMSVMLHDLSPLHSKYVNAAMSRDGFKEKYYEDKLLVWYRKWQTASEAVLMSTVQHLVSKVNDYISFALDANNYRDDPYDSLFITVESKRWSFSRCLQDEQKGKNLLLVAYSAQDFFAFYDEIPYNLRPKREEVLLHAPSVKRPRIVPVYRK